MTQTPDYSKKIFYLLVAVLICSALGGAGWATYVYFETQRIEKAEYDASLDQQALEWANHIKAQQACRKLIRAQVGYSSRYDQLVESTCGANGQ